MLKDISVDSTYRQNNKPDGKAKQHQHAVACRTHVGSTIDYAGTIAVALWMCLMLSIATVRQSYNHFLGPSFGQSRGTCSIQFQDERYEATQHEPVSNFGYTDAILRACISEARWSRSWVLGGAFELAAQYTLIAAGFISIVNWRNPKFGYVPFEGMC